MKVQALIDFLNRLNAPDTEVIIDYNQDEPRTDVASVRLCLEDEGEIVVLMAGKVVGSTDD